MKKISRTVFLLSLVSLFADIASEMLYPVVPVYLKEIGFSVLLIGILEGIAGFTAGISKGYFGKWSDEKGKRLPFIRTGYLLSALSKPMMAAFTFPLWIFFARTTDRLGKGIRTAARDAMLSENATPETKGHVFGFHRSMDTLGAAMGPAITLLLIWLFPGNFKMIFLLAFIPGIISVALLFLLSEKTKPAAAGAGKGFFSYFSYWKKSSREYRKLAGGLIFFALFNSSDIFLLLKAREITGSDLQTIAAYVLYNLVFALASWPLGSLGDRLGLRQVMVSGLLVFSIVYLLFAFAGTATMVFTGFVLYGLYAAATEGVSKAWITNLAPAQTGTAVGLYTSCQSIAAMLASTIAGLIWTTSGSATVFIMAAAAAFISFAYFLFLVPQTAAEREKSAS